MCNAILIDDLLMKDADDNYCMRRAISIAARTNPSIRGKKVGAVMVNGGRIVAEGHRDFAFNVYDVYEPAQEGNLVVHAERAVLYRAGELARGSTLYITIEPCVACDESTDIVPCSELIARAGIARVVVGLLDPNHFIQGKGLEYMKWKGINADIIHGFEDMIGPLVLMERKADLDDGRDWRHCPYALGAITPAERKARASARYPDMHGIMDGLDFPPMVYEEARNHSVAAERKRK